MNEPVNGPFSQACENNKAPIFEVLARHLTAPGEGSGWANSADPCRVLEIGSGTGQHAVHFAARLPWLTWLTSDLPANHEGIRRWLDAGGLANTRPPLHLDVTAEPWPVARADAVFSANTAHIMHWPAVTALFAGVGRVLADTGPFLLYGPFRYHGAHTSDSNAAFDRSLQRRDPGMGIRDFEALDGLAAANGLTLVEDNALPANNHLLVWRRRERR